MSAGVTVVWVYECCPDGGTVEVHSSGFKAGDLDFFCRLLWQPFCLLYISRLYLAVEAYTTITGTALRCRLCKIAYDSDEDNQDEMGKRSWSSPVDCEEKPCGCFHCHPYPWIWRWTLAWSAGLSSGDASPSWAWPVWHQLLPQLLPGSHRPQTLIGCQWSWVRSALLQAHSPCCLPLTL